MNNFPTVGQLFYSAYTTVNKHAWFLIKGVIASSLVGIGLLVPFLLPFIGVGVFSPVDKSQGFAFFADKPALLAFCIFSFMVLVVGFFFICSYFAVGWSRARLELVRTGSSSLGAIFKQSWSMIFSGAGSLALFIGSVYIPGILILIPAFILKVYDFELLGGVALICAICAALVVMAFIACKGWFHSYYVADGASAVKSLKKSYSLTVMSKLLGIGAVYFILSICLDIFIFLALLFTPKVLVIIIRVMLSSYLGLITMFATTYLYEVVTKK